MFFERLSLRQATQTLRFRLMVWNAIVVLLTAMAILIAVREGLRFSLLSEMDQVLRQDVAEVNLSVRELPLAALHRMHEDLNRKAQGHQQDRWFIQFLDNQSQEVWASKNTPEVRPQSPLFRDSHPLSVSGQRMLQQTLTTADRQDVTVRVGASLNFLSRDMQRIDRLSMLIVFTVLVAAPISGYWLAGRATKPLASMIHIMARLRPAKLDERLTIRRTGDELDQLSLTFNRLLDRIAEHLQEHRDSMSNAAHELRTPLAAIRSSIEVCLNEQRTYDEYKELLANLIDECQSLETLVNQLLLLAEAEADRLKNMGQYVDFHTVLERCVDMFRGVADFKHVELCLDPPPAVLVEGNRNHLRQLLNNLFDNALKFTPPDGRITITLERDEQQRRAILKVQDTGFGISAEELPHIFERFYRGDRSRRRDQETRGTGLGLCICQSVVLSHRGTIDVSSTPGKGTTFTITLPLLDADL
ncbi:MAG TPA: HAMP domain-containing sensor histidine kinase, partial [Pirellulaceae bacterium]|nr:HAMP domain-containing sensor histidine kinase [Pirellulaceae bacterium]